MARQNACQGVGARTKALTAAWAAASAESPFPAAERITRAAAASITVAAAWSLNLSRSPCNGRKAALSACRRWRLPPRRRRLPCFGFSGAACLCDETRRKQRARGQLSHDLVAETEPRGSCDFTHRADADAAPEAAQHAHDVEPDQRVTAERQHQLRSQAAQSAKGCWQPPATAGRRTAQLVPSGC